MAKKEQKIVQSYPYDWLPAWGNTNSPGYYPKRAFWNNFKAKSDIFENPDKTGRKIVGYGQYIKNPEDLKWVYENFARTVKPGDNNRVAQFLHCTSFAFVLLDEGNPDKNFTISINCARAGQPGIEYTFVVHSKRLYMMQGDYVGDFFTKMYQPVLQFIGNNVESINFMQQRFKIIPVEFLIPNPYDLDEWEKAKLIYRDGLKMGTPNGLVLPPMVEKGKFEFYHKDFEPREQFNGATFYFEKPDVEVNTSNE